MGSLTGLEPAASRVTILRSNQLSYKDRMMEGRRVGAAHGRSSDGTPRWGLGLALAPVPARTRLPPMIRSFLLALILVPALLVAAEGPTGPLDFTLRANDGTAYALTQHRGQVVLLVNVASRCGLTKQYGALQALHQQHAKAGLVVIGIPANDFMGQEPGTDAEIAAFCSTTYGVTFPLMAKVSVKGEAMDPLYAWLTTSSPFPGPIGWNFAKFLIGRDGTVIARFEPKVTPTDPAFTAAITQALAAPVP